jgi:hypothetical protein
MLYQNSGLSTETARLFPLRRLSKTLPHCRSSPRSIPLGNCTYILAFGVEKGALVGRSYIFGWRKNCKREGNEKERGEDLSHLYSALISLRPHNTS